MTFVQKMACAAVVLASAEGSTSQGTPIVLVPDTGKIK